MIKQKHCPIVAMAVLCVCLTGCADNFSWQEPSTWHFENKEAKKLRELREACIKQNAHNDRRVLLMNGVTAQVEHTECQPYTDGPLGPQRMKGR